MQTVTRPAQPFCHCVEGSAANDAEIGDLALEGFDDTIFVGGIKQYHRLVSFHDRLDGVRPIESK
jgi:hypothetical protein